MNFNFSQLFLFFCFIIKRTQEFNCNFDDYESSLLDQNDPFQNVSINVKYELDYLYSSGFWSKYIEYKTMNQSHVIDQIDLGIEKGRLLYMQKQMSSNGKKEYNITIYQKYLFSTFHWRYYPYHILEVSYVQDSETKFKSQSLQLDNQKLDGIWHLTLIEYNPKLSILQFKSAGNFDQISSITLKSGQINYILGGYGKDSYNQQSYKPFQGLFSKLITYNKHQEPNLYQEITDDCQVPDQNQQIQQISLLDGITNFDGTKYIYKEAQLIDQHYVVRGWIKIDVTKIFLSAQMQILRMTINKQYQLGNGNNGDKTFFLLYKINMLKSDMNSIDVQTYHYFYPFKSEYESSYYDQDKYTFKSNTLLSDIQNWHYFTFEQGRSQNTEKTQFKLWFDLQSDPIIYNFQFLQARNQFSNALIYFFIGGDKFTPSPYFQGQLAYLEFLTGFQEDFNIQKFKQCHYSCQNCLGPQSNECISCSEDSKRQYLSETKECKCQINYLDITNNEICSNQFSAFPDIQFDQINIDQDTFLCNFGYFFIQNNQNQRTCKQCPFYKQNQFLCLNCYRDPMNWYLEPICTQDMIQNETIVDAAYQQIDRDQIDYDVFTINQFEELELQIGVQGYIKNLDKNNNNIYEAFHLGQYVYLQCKSNFILMDEKCQKCPENCLQCNNLQECLKCHQDFYLSQNKCIICPFICNECYQNEYSLEVICKNCKSPYHYIDKTCRQCGQNCQECIEDYNTDTEQYFLRCLKCLDDQQYFISNDAQNCEKNTISNCKYALKLRLYNNGKTTFTTLDYYFKPSYDSIELKCAKCNEGYRYDYYDNLCKIDVYYGEECQYRITWYLTKCIVGQITDYELTTGCQSDISFCTNCLYNQFKEKKECYQCEQGYYSSRIFGNCQICPEELHCKTCYQQDKLSQDNWKQELRSFYYAAIQYYDISHDFNEFGQSSEIDDFQLVCLECVQDFELYNKQCIPQCPALCLECKISNYVNVCIKCPLEVNQRIISLYDNQCIKCPPNCILCRKRTSREISQINPLFNNENYSDYSNQCLDFDSNSNNYYNSYFGLIFQLNDNKIQTQNQILLELNLICSEMTYRENTINLDDSQIFNFNQTHIILEDLQYFTQFNKESFYKMANDIQATSLSINLISNIDQECSFNGDFIISQQFSQSIFTLIHVNLSIISTKNTKFIIDKSLQFINFQNVLINTIEFEFQNKGSPTILLFSSILEYFQVRINNSIFQQSNINSVQFNFTKVSQLYLQNLTFNNFRLEQQNQMSPLFLINFDSNLQNMLSINLFSFLNSHIYDTNIFQLNDGNLISDFQNILLTGVFSNSTFIKVIKSPFSTIKISNFSLQGELYKSSGFMQLQDFQQIILQQILISHSLIQSTNLIILNNNSYIEDFNCSNNIIQNESKILVNIENSEIDQFKLVINLILFCENLYDQLSNFLKTKDFNYIHSQIIINNIQIIENRIQDNEILNETIKYEIALINLEAQDIHIQQLFLLRGFGISELRMINSKKLLINNIEIQLSDKYYLKGIHKHLDCWIKYVQKSFYTIFLIIYNAIQTQIESMIMCYLVAINEPLIYYESISTSILIRDESINIYNSKIYDNLQLVLDKYTNSPILEIYSKQNISIKIEEIKFMRNILQDYTQDDSYISSSLIYIDCQKSYVIFKLVTFDSNTLINSISTLVFINSLSIAFDSVQFNNSCLFDYLLIWAHLQWGYKLESIIYLEDIQSDFQQKCLVGNAILQSPKIEMVNFISNNSFGQISGSLQIKVQSSGQIMIDQSRFENIVMAIAQYYDSIQQGATIYMATESILNIRIINSYFQSINSYVSGGILFLNENQDQLKLEFENLTITNCYSLKGDILYRHISSYNLTNQNFRFKDLVIENNYQGFLNYQNQANYYYQAVKQLQLYLLSDRTKIYLIAGSIQMDNIKIQQIYFESLIIGYNLKRFFLSNSIIQVGILPINSLISLNNQGFQSECVIRQVLIQNLTTDLKSINQGENIQTNYTTFIQKQQICLTKFNNDYAPIFVNSFYNPDFYYNKTLILFDELKLYYQSQTIMPILLLTNITSYVQFKFIELQIQDINCETCQLSLLFLQQNQEHKMSNEISFLNLQNNNCGLISCLIITDKSISQSDIYINNRLLVSQEENEILIQQVSYDVELIEYKCQQNQGVYGTCLFSKDQNILIKNSQLINNYAKIAGGAIYFQGQNKLLTLLSSKISQNQAQFGGGIYTQNSSISNYSRMGTIIENNKGTKFGNQQSTNPTHISITLNDYGSIFFTNITTNKSNLLIEEVIVQNKLHYKNKYVNVIYLPSGQKLSEYQYFDLKNRIYQSMNLTFRIVLLNDFREIYHNLSNSKCFLKSRIYNLDLSEDKQDQFSNNYTNKKEVLFDSINLEYNLDDLILYYNTGQKDELILQLEIQCEKVFIPNYKSQFPFEILNYHNNYSLYINVKTFPCQYGEIVNKTFGICELCDSKQNFYQLKLNQEKCNLQDEVSIKQVTPTQLNLHQGYWRAYFDTNQVEYCYNLPESCLGGWKEGDDSCVNGHIGALCEQCDIEDLRGQGRYSISGPYQCGICSNQQTNLFAIIGISIWTLLTILIAAKNTVAIVINKLLIVKLRKAGLIIIPQPLDEGILCKILTNYFQIIMTITTFRLEFPNDLDYTINSAGNPIKTIAYSLDCFLIYVNQIIELHYLRMLWQIIMPILYILLFLSGYGVCIVLKRCKYHFTVLSTTFINMYIILQPSLIEGFIKLMSYRQISGYPWISINVAYRFDTDSHFNWILYFCFPFLILIAIIIPLIFFICLFYNRHDLDNNDSRMNWGFLYNEYKKSGYFWEIVKLIEKELIIVILSFYETSIIIKAILIYIVIYIYQQLTIVYKPYESNVLNQLDHTMTQICSLSIVLGVGIYVSKENKEIIYPLYILLTIINVYFVYQLIKNLLKAYLIELSNDLLMICQKLKKYIKFDWFQKCRFLENKEEKQKRIKNKFNSIKKSILTVSRVIKEGRKETELSIVEEKNNRQIRQEQIQKEINSVVQKQQISLVSRDLEITLQSSKGGKPDTKLFSKVYPEPQ